jgi:hypothetical protein
MLSLVSVVRVNSAGRFNPEIIFESAAFKIVLFKPRSAASAFANTRCARVANLLAGVGADKSNPGYSLFFASPSAARCSVNSQSLSAFGARSIPIGAMHQEATAFWRRFRGAVKH